ncbi:MAG: DUF192 domain-containing protein [Thermoanaerobaculia bacterium]
MKVLAMLLLVAGCTKTMPPAPANETQSAPVATTTSGPRVILPDGSAVSVEIVADDELRAQGLMFRDHLDPSAGMLFFFPAVGEYPFWMKNTRIPLDMIWIDAGRRIAAIKSDVPPCRTEDCPSYPPNAQAQYVLEIAGGEAKRHGLKVGDQLRFEGTDHVIAR